MIPFDFAYYKPASLQEAVQLYGVLAGQGKAPLYYSGGTEIITLGRLNLLRTDAVIDIKGIPQCHALHLDAGRLTIGAAVTLTTLSESGHFPLLGKTCSQIADRTARNKITLGGVICSRIIYREAVLPLLVADADLVVAGPGGVRMASIHEVFDQEMRLGPGEMVVQVQVDPLFTQLPFVHRKRRRIGHVGYPVVTLAALKRDGAVRVALSGLVAFPFRSRLMEARLNEPGIPLQVRVERALQLLPAPVLDDVEASAGYRAFVARQALADALQALEGVSG